MTISEYCGLSGAQVLRSRQLHGTNLLTPPRRTPRWRQYLAKWGDPIIIILVVAGVLSFATAAYEYYCCGASGMVFFSPAGVFLAVLLSTGIAFYFEQRATREFSLLRHLDDSAAISVIRDGTQTSVPRQDLVVGDVVLLHTGDEVPADGELLSTEGTLLVDEATLTGEALCHKTTVPEDFDSSATYPSNHVLRGTKVMEGTAVMRVRAVGDNTECGALHLAASLDNGVATPLDEQLQRLARWMTRGGYTLALILLILYALFFVLRGGASQPLDSILVYALHAIMTAVTIVVIVVPEGLPMAVTLSLAMSMQRMFKTKNLVRTLHACETMGAATVICTDKTGTLTETRLSDRAALTGTEVVRTGVEAAIRDCQRAGIAVKIVTGDTPARARVVAEEIGLMSAETPAEGTILTGAALSAMDDAALSAVVDDIIIVAQARPMDKRRLVEILQKKGHIVAVTGDGTNDAPALTTAHVGISMGAGTDVAKSASDITILDNSFVSICRAVLWGRSLYKNIQRFLLFQLTVNVSACLLVLAGTALGTAIPLTLTQMLWVNIIMDTFGATALAALPPAQGVMSVPPRRREDFVLTRDMLANIVGVGVVFFLIPFALLYIFSHADITCLGDLCHMHLTATTCTVTPYERTLLFSVFVWLHFWYLFCSRCYGTSQSLFTLARSGGFITIVVLIILGQLVIVEGAYNFFDVTPLLHHLSAEGGGLNMTGLKDLLTIVAGTSLVLWSREIWHLLKHLTRHEQQ